MIFVHESFLFIALEITQAMGQTQTSKTDQIQWLDKAVYGYIRRQYKKNDFPEELNRMCIQYYFDRESAAILNTIYQNNWWKWSNTDNSEIFHIRCSLVTKECDDYPIKGVQLKVKIIKVTSRLC